MVFQEKSPAGAKYNLLIRLGGVRLRVKRVYANKKGVYALPLPSRISKETLIRSILYYVVNFHIKVIERYLSIFIEVFKM